MRNFQILSLVLQLCFLNCDSHGCIKVIVLTPFILPLMATSTSASTILFVDLPPQTFVGIDLVSFNSSPNFHGITNVPSGLHFVYTGTDALLSIRNGYWLNVTSTDTLLYTLKWTPEEESLVLLPPAVSSNPPSRGLADYSALTTATSNINSQDAEPPTSPADFPALTSHITPSTLTRILSSSWTISSISSSPRDNETDSIPGLTCAEASSAFAGHDSALHLLDINLKQTWDDADIGRIRTERARDRSWYLGQLMDTAGNGNGGSRQAGAKEVLAELQVCFLMVLTLANYSCLQQWKRLLTVVLTCREAAGEIEGYFAEVLRMLGLQLRHADDVEWGLFELRDEMGSGWLRGLVQGFVEVVSDIVGEEGELGREMRRFEEGMQERFGWEGKGSMLRRGMLELEDGERVEVSLDGADRDEERGEYAPVVVET